MMRRALRTQSPITMMILDLDHFKLLNDKHGHEAGNISLKRISQILKAKFRVTDVIARFGGDEFEILLPDVTTEKSLVIAESLIELIRNEKFPLQISGTIGIATYPTHALDSQSLFLAADQALYLGKEKGRNCAVVSNIDVKISLGLLSQKKDSIPLSVFDATFVQESFPENIKKDIQRIDGLDIISRIGSSSNGEVLLVKQHELERFVALKRPLTTNLTEEQSAAFKKEAFITASLSHPGVIPLHSMGKGIDGRLYYTMKPLKGVSLEDLLNKWKSKDRQTVKEYNLFKLIHILLKTSETVAYAHSLNIIH
jgi:diguanylate cyclase (GGDEF)-like protein